MVSFSRYFTIILFSPFTSKLATYQCYIRFSYLPLSTTLEKLLSLPMLALTAGKDERIFKNQYCSQNLIIHKVVQWTTKFFFLVCPAKNIKLKYPRIIKWNALPKPLIKLNTNGSSSGNPSLVGVGRLLRNSSRDWISSFSLHTVITSNNIAKLGVVR